MARERANNGQWLRGLAFLIVFGLMAGFAGYAGHVSALETPAGLRADGIIVLTGGEGRLQRAVQLLEDGAGDRLLVSGVNPSVSGEALRNSASIDRDLFDCCIDLGREATDTVGNAREAVAWAEEHGFDRLIIVTSDYHIPRSILELRALMPERELIAYPVASPRPWENATAARRWALEYLKFSAVFVRELARGSLSDNQE
ncbi:YdcF family protein [Hyphobacterium sp. HN65]|uniref:YdcF family protein n=1 Tax=Hyphobacterium lacteum TaxID=3116575 RepID=A0ABU7LQ20_9PROT|nr:YdcF family protein [Hyphobacterium sp. HN65]MEE2526001.1 YdcF family protein [Hyphobacterium sp. HN65]